MVCDKRELPEPATVRGKIGTCGRNTPAIRITEKTMISGWLHGLSIAYLSLGALAAMTIAADEIKHPQHMWIMNVVWPVTALFARLVCGSILPMGA